MSFFSVFHIKHCWSHKGFSLPVRRKSSGAKSSGDLYGKLSTNHPWPNGLKATKAMPSSFAVSINPLDSWRVSKAEYSAWIASIVATTIHSTSVKVFLVGEKPQLTWISLAKGCSRALGKTNILGFSSLSDLVQGRNRLFEWGIYGDHISTHDWTSCIGDVKYLDQFGGGNRGQVRSRASRWYPRYIPQYVRPSWWLCVLR